MCYGGRVEGRWTRKSNIYERVKEMYCGEGRDGAVGDAKNGDGHYR